ncbi:MAG TPA: SDR family oxidoreductase [Candidatus Acidoferrales bacterium]|nr:SDR family oxidoreductase [Candidatus Acidoferrales bacterium]
MTDGNDLEGRAALVTGASRGIGAAIAKELAALGATVFLVGRNRTALGNTAQRIAAAGGKAETFCCDVTSLDEVHHLAEHVRQRCGQLYVLVNNAGLGNFSTPLHEMPPEQFDSILNTNLRAVYYMIREFAPGMMAAKAGHIINISSIASKNALRNGAAYAASKWGLNGLSVSVAEELRDYGVRVSIICPGSTETSLSPHEGKRTDRMLQPEDIAHVVRALVTQTTQSFISEVVIRPTRKP